MKYRKKPIVVDAYPTDTEVIIHTLEGNMIANAGDYIITGVNGEQYPCKPDIFHKTYEPVNITEICSTMNSVCTHCQPGACSYKKEQITVVE